MEETGASEEGMWFCHHCLVCNYMGLCLTDFFYRYIRHIWQNEKHVQCIRIQI